MNTDTEYKLALTSWELEQAYNEMLDEVYGTVNIAGYEYDTSKALKEIDPIAYRVGMNDYESQLEQEDN
jgi:hypothetical protein